MKNITIISFIFILLGYLSIIPVSSAQNSLIKAKKRCNSISQRPSSGLDQIDQIIQGNSNLINMTDGLRDTCEVLQTIENEISARSLPSVLTA